ncbi:hypothetical protein [Flavobacterium alkalisoli]|uniref:hypothetical protein n=1 Tax=Flavobacterium alkalisoli TaxID=2602769 RepID=UPI003A938D29
MKTFKTKITDQFGNRQPLEISIDENKKTGTLIYLQDTFPISNCMKSSATNGLVFLMHIGEFIKLRAGLFVVCNEVEGTITLMAGNTPHKYPIQKDTCDEFKNFADNLNLPVTSQGKDVDDENPIQEVIIKMPEDAPKAHLSMFIGWYPYGQGALANFKNIAVNNTDMDLSHAYDLPTGNGTIVPLGMLDPKKDYLLAWECRSNYSGDAKTSVGYFLNNNLNNRVILKTKNIDAFEEWADSAIISIP